MRLIYATGFSKQEREEWRAIIFSNILSAFKTILEAMEDLEIPFDEKKNEVKKNHCDLCLLAALTYLTQQYIHIISVDHDLGPKEPLPMDYLSTFKSLWADAGVQKCMTRGNEFALHDNLN